MRHALLIVLACARPATADELAMRDLHALDAAHQWSELLATAERVKPSARSADWPKLVTSAATHVVELAGEHVGDLVRTIPSAERRYPFLVRDKAYLDRKARALALVAADCARQPDDACGEVVVALAAGIARFPAGQARELARLVDPEAHPVEAVPLWAAAVADDRAACEEIRLGRAVVTVLATRADADAAGARDLAARCFAQLDSALFDELVASERGSVFARNACPLLRAHHGARVELKKKCN